jgi:hypothetical protein
MAVAAKGDRGSVALRQGECNGFLMAKYGRLDIRMAEAC